METLDYETRNTGGGQGVFENEIIFLVLNIVIQIAEAVQSLSRSQIIARNAEDEIGGTFTSILNSIHLFGNFLPVPLTL